MSKDKKDEKTELEKEAELLFPSSSTSSANVDANIDPNVEPNIDPNVDPNVEPNIDPNVEPNVDPNVDAENPKNLVKTQVENELFNSNSKTSENPDPTHIDNQSYDIDENMNETDDDSESEDKVGSDISAEEYVNKFFELTDIYRQWKLVGNVDDKDMTNQQKKLKTKLQNRLTDELKSADLDGCNLESIYLFHEGNILYIECWNKNDVSSAIDVIQYKKYY